MDTSQRLTLLAYPVISVVSNIILKKCPLTDLMTGLQTAAGLLLRINTSVCLQPAKFSAAAPVYGQW